MICLMRMQSLLTLGEKVFASKGSKECGSMERNHIQGNYTCCWRRVELSNIRMDESDKIARHQFLMKYLKLENLGAAGSNEDWARRI